MDQSNFNGSDPRSELHFGDIETRKVKITFFKDELAFSLRTEDLTLPQLADRIAKQAAASKMELPWLKLAIFR